MLHGELVKRLVGVERADHVVTVGPDVATIIIVQAVSVCVAGVIEPVARTLLAEGGPRQQTVHQMFVGTRRGVLQECEHFVRGGQQSGEVERNTPDKNCLFGFRRRAEAGLFQLCKNEVINWRLYPCSAGLWHRNSRTSGYFEGPMRTIHRPFTDPLP